MPGHGHQDVGSFDLRYGGGALFSDPGRGSYADGGDGICYANADVHSGIMIDGLDPYPVNRPYYDDGFRREVCGPPPRLARRGEGVRLTFDGFSRLRGLGAVERTWTFDDRRMSLTDRIDGNGEHSVSRRFHTTGDVIVDGSGAVIVTAGRRFRLDIDGPVRISPATSWSAYGVGVPSRLIDVTAKVRLPAELSATVSMI